MTFLAACGGDGTTAGSQPTGTFSAVPSAAGSAPVATDVEICKSADEAKRAMITALFAGIDGDGNVPPAVSQKVLDQAGETLTKMAESGGDSEVASAVKELGAEVSKAAAAPDPFKAVDSASFTAAGERFKAACKKAGYTTTS